MASVDATMQAINQACRAKGGPYATYSCQVVSWDDVSRSTVGGSLSCWGANITDTYLKSKHGARLFTVRSSNWNEKLGVVKAEEVAVVASTHSTPGAPLQPVTLRSVLQRLGDYGSYAGLEQRADLSDASLDSQCSIRFQTTFIPVDASADGRGKLEFATEAYNYNTMSDADPRNLVLLCTSQGMAVQQDGAGTKKLFHHAVDDYGKIHRYWLEAEESQHQVGGQQRESAEERADALARGKATSSVIGVRAMGQRFNVLMTIQVPLQPQQKKRMFSGASPGLPTPFCMDLAGAAAGGSVCSSVPYSTTAKKAGGMMPTLFSMFQGFQGGSVPYSKPAPGCAVLSSSNCSDDLDEFMAIDHEGDYLSDLSQAANEVLEDDDDYELVGSLDDSLSANKECAAAPTALRSCRSRGRGMAGKGRSSAARVSRGTEHDVWPGLSVKSPKRNVSEHVTITVVIYNAVQGGVPTQEDVAAAIDDLESLYRSCSDSGRLAEPTFNFMKEGLKVDDLVDIGTKLKYQPPAVEVLQHDVFPTA